MGIAIERMSEDTGYQFGPRGWAYYAEGLGLITKGDFSRFTSLLTDMRKAGELNPDVIEPDLSRMATEVDDYESNYSTEDEHAENAISDISDRLEIWARIYHEHGFWDHLDYYVEMIVEKKDLVQIFQTTSDKYNIRVTNGKGDTDIHTRLAMLKRFKEHTEEGRRCILLAVGDHDPKGLQIVEGLHNTLMSCANIKGLDWDYPEFDVVNIGLTEEQIDDMGLMRINNLETGGGKDLASPNHADFNKTYVQDYIERFGIWKCEANALVSNPAAAQNMLEDAINEFIPQAHLSDIRERNQPAQQRVRGAVAALMEEWTFGD